MLLNLNVDKVNIKDKLQKYPKNIQTVKKRLLQNRYYSCCITVLCKLLKKKLFNFF